MTDYKLLAQSLAPDIPESDLDRITAPLDALEKAFRPLVSSIPHETEPAIGFVCPPEESR
jgi:hypothetical protein